MERLAINNAWFRKEKSERSGARTPHPFWVIVRKEMSDQITSWRFIILIVIMLLTCIASLYTSLSSIRDVVPSNSDLNTFLFLKLFTVSDGTIPSFITFLSFLGPLVGVALGFDAVNSERNKGTLSRIMSQPIHRDYIINAKFVAALFVVGIMFLALGFLVMGIGLFDIGVPPSPEEFLRMVSFLIVSVFYVAFWLNLSILFSVRFRQPATSALSGFALWLFFSIFYSMILSLIAKSTAPSADADMQQILGYEKFISFLEHISPSQLFSDATTTLLMPSVRTLSPFVTPEQAYGALPGSLPFGQSLLLVWPQLTGLIAATMVCFAISYVWFMRQEIRSR